MNAGRHHTYCTTARATKTDESVTNRLRGRAKKSVFVDAHPDANYGRVIQVMDLIRECGAEHVGFADLKDEGPAKLDPAAVLPGTAPAAVPG